MNMNEVKKWAKERAEKDPQGTIEKLLQMQTNQAQSIHRKSEEIARLEKEIKKLQKALKKEKKHENGPNQDG